MSWKDILKGEDIHPSVEGHVERGQRALQALKENVRTLENTYNTVPLSPKEEKEMMKRIKDLHADIDSLQVYYEKHGMFPLYDGRDVKFTRERETIDEDDKKALRRLDRKTSDALEEKVKKLIREQKITNHQRNILNRAISEGWRDDYKHLRELAQKLDISFDDAFTSAKQ